MSGNDTSCSIDLAEALSKYAAENGIDLQELLEKCGAHFTDSVLTPHGDLTPEAIDVLVEDDIAAFLEVK